MGFLGDIWSALVEGIKGIWRMCVKVVKAVVNFFADIFNWLKDFFEDDDDDKDGFIVDWPELIDDAKKTGNVVDIGLRRRKGVGVGVFDHNTGKITAFKSIDADARDSKTDEILGGRKLVVVE